MKDFFENKKLIRIVDAMAQRYGKLPSEILNELTIEEYNLNLAIMVAAVEYGKEKEECDKNPPEWSNLGIKYSVKKKEEKNK
jgi:hypothetical protein